MKTVTPKDIGCEFTVLTGLRSTCPKTPPKGEIHILENGEVYNFEGPARMLARHGESWFDIYLAPDVSRLEGPLIFSNLETYDLDQEARRLVEADGPFMMTDFMIMSCVSAIGFILAALLTHSVPVAMLVGVVTSVFATQYAKKTIRAPERIFRNGLKRHRFDFNASSERIQAA